MTDELVNLARIIDGHDGAARRADQPQPDDHLRRAARRRRPRCAAAWPRLGVGDGDRVAIVCGNGHPFVIAYLAVVGLGAVAVPLNPASPAPELEHELGVVDAVAVVVDRSAAGAWRTVDRAALATIEHVITVDGDAIDGADRARRAARRRAAARRRRRPRPPRRADVHQRHGRRARGGDAHPRQPARQHRAGPLGARPGQRRRRRLRRDPGCSTSSGSTWCSA